MLLVAAYYRKYLFPFPHQSLTILPDFLMTLLEIVFIEWRPFKLLNIRTVRHQAFARLWSAKGEAMSEEMPGPTFSLLSKCRGVILDIGPGSGELLSRFNPDMISAMYGAEPSGDLHPRLAENAAKRGFGDKFHPLVCGAEPESLIPALHKAGILEVTNKGSAADGIFDEICCTRVLCSVPHPQQTIKSLYTLLKPGGRMVVAEHVVNPWRTDGSMLARLAQFVFDTLGHAYFICPLQRHTVEFLREAGEWDQFELKYYGEAGCVPFVVGELIKKHATMDKSYAKALKE